MPAIRRCESRTEINGYSILDGQYKTNISTFFIKLKDFKERFASSAKAQAGEFANAVLQHAAAGARDIQQGKFIPIAPPAIPGIGTTGGFEFWIQDKEAGDRPSGFTS